MSRARKIAIIVSTSLLGLLLIATIAGVLISRTQWFRDMVRDRIIAEVEDSTGGRVEIRTFAWDWKTLTAGITEFVLHGKEPANAAPLLRARSLEVRLKLTSPLKKMVDIASLTVNEPQANIIVFPDGTTNVPAPKIKKPGDKSALQTVVDLAVGRFDLRNGSIQFAERRSTFQARGQNLRALLAYNALNTSYQGTIAMNPLYAQSGGRAPVPLNVSLPVRLEKDRITLDGARIESPESKVSISGTVEHMQSPRTTAHVNASVSLAELVRATGTTMQLDLRGDTPKILNADLAVSMDENRVSVQSARLSLGGSNVEASGVLKDEKSGNGSLQFNARLAADELGRMLRTPTKVGVVQVGGKAALRGTSDIQISSLQLKGLGGSFTGQASMQDLQRFRVQGTLHNFDTRQILGSLANTSADLNGIVSGPIEAEGDLKAPGTTGIQARANLTVAPGRSGTPVSGRITLNYNGRANTVDTGNTQINLPNTRITLAGSLGKQIQVRLASRNLNDLKSLTGGKPLPVALNGGAATFTGTVTGTLTDPRIAGHLLVTNFKVGDRPFDRLETDLNVSPSAVNLANGSLRRKVLDARFEAAAGLQRWRPEKWEPLQAQVSIQNADMQDILAFAGQRGLDVTGMVTASARVGGTIGDPRGNADLIVSQGTVYDTRFDSFKARVNYGGQRIDLPSAEITAGASRVNLNASFDHPLNSFSTGRLQVHMAGNQIDLAQFETLQRERSGLAGTLQITADAAANLNEVRGRSEFQVSAVNGSANVRGLRMNREDLGDISVTARTNWPNLVYQLDSNFGGSSTHIAGQSRLDADHATSANLNIANLPIGRVLAVAGRRDLGISGNLSAQGQVSGTLDDPRANLQLSVIKGVVQDEHFDRLTARISYSNQLIDLSGLTLAAYGGQLDMSGSFSHPPDNLKNGRIILRLTSSKMQLTQVAALQRQRPGVAGVLQMTANGDATLKNGRLLPSILNADVSATGVQVNKKPAGDLRLTAVTRGNSLEFNLNSDFANAKINGSGNVTLTGDYPVKADLGFTNLTYAGLRPWLGAAAEARQDFGAAADGRVTISGPLERVNDLRGSLELSRIELRSIGKQAAGQKSAEASVKNAGPVVVSLDRSTINVQSAHLVGSGTDIAIAGTASLAGNQPLNLRVNGSVDLKNAEALGEGVFASGAIALNAVIQGTMAAPAPRGTLTLKNASLNTIDLPNGLSNANGTVSFTGKQAVVQNIRGEVGGGKVALNGTVGYGTSEMNFQLRATADRVRIQNEAGITVDLSAQLHLQGTTASSVLAGGMTVNEVAYRPQTDFGSILSQAGEPPQAPEARTGLLGGMRLDVRIDTADDIRFVTTLAQNLSAEAHLRLRGLAYQPGMLGRARVTRGEVVFFGNKYNVNQATVNFFNPSRIEPVFNVDLETQTKGVDVIVSVSGPLSKMKLSYRSDPPLPFSDIVGLLATGKIPTSDPVLAAKEPVAPQQSLGQMGASALVGQAIANPVSGRLQRLFGVTKLKIDPQITGAANTPQARMTFEQQISREVTFTYIQDVTQSNPQIVRVEWAISPRWSAVALRDTNGVLGLDFFYKKQIR